MPTSKTVPHKHLIYTSAVIRAAAAVVGGKEHAGPLGAHFDFFNDRDRFGEDSWERAESEMQRIALDTALGKAGLTPDGVELLFAGDLLNQCVGSAYGLECFGIPFCGLYGACSTAAEGLLLAAGAVSGGIAEVAAVVTSSHNAAAERQFRTPLEYGGQRPPTGQWTVTGAGAFVVEAAHVRPGDVNAAMWATSDAEGASASRPLACITAVMPGIVVDAGITDQTHMGAAMAPAALSTLERFFAATATAPGDYDLIVTGDLGWEGSRILCDLFAADGGDIAKRHTDCGMLIFSRNTQDTHSGGSGCGCSATVLAGYLLPKLASGELSRMLFMATGALMSPDAVKQGRSIPGIAHLICLESPTIQTSLFAAASYSN